MSRRKVRLPLLAVTVMGLSIASGAVVVGQSAAPSAAPPTAWSGRMQFGDCSTGSRQVVDGVTRKRGIECRLRVIETSDPRLDGDVTLHINRDDYPDGLCLIRWAYRIENAGGAWQQEPAFQVVHPDGTSSMDMIVLVGEGGYEGLTAVADPPPPTGDIWSLQGYIVDGPVPADPQ